MSVKNNERIKNDDEKSTIQIKNDYLKKLSVDNLYHLALGTKTHDLRKMFGDVKFVCMGGTPHRMKTFTEHMMKEINYEFPIGGQLFDLAAEGKRFSMYKVGPVLSVSHGMGMPSISILLHEIIKLLYYAKCIDPVLIRIGTSGGIGVEPGTVIITDKSFNGLLKAEHEFIILGKRVSRPTFLDDQLKKELLECALDTDEFKTQLGHTMATDDFYEGQGRIDGAICEHNETEKQKFLEQAFNIGVRNIEMECSLFSVLTHKTGIRAADVCVTMLDRLKGDQVKIDSLTKAKLESMPQIIVGRYIRKSLLKSEIIKGVK